MECYASSTSHSILCFGEKAEGSSYQRYLETFLMRERCGGDFLALVMTLSIMVRTKIKLLTSSSTTISHKVGILQKLSKEILQEGSW